MRVRLVVESGRKRANDEKGGGGALDAKDRR